MNKHRLIRRFVALTVLLMAASVLHAGEAVSPSRFAASLTGYQEVPPVFTEGNGSLNVKVSSDGTMLFYELRYSGLSSSVTQAHIHFGQQPINGGIIVFLCDNTGKARHGVPACPNSGTVKGTITATDVNPPLDPEPVTGQGIAAGDFAGLLGALGHGDAYGNVHTSDFPAGEIRGWLR